MKLIDILNKIANGELKEGSKIKYGEDIYVWGNNPFPNAFYCKEKGYCLDPVICINDECEIIEQQTDIEGLDADYYEDQPKDYTIRAIIKKLNEVIRVLNKE